MKPVQKHGQLQIKIVQKMSKQKDKLIVDDDNMEGQSPNRKKRENGIKQNNKRKGGEAGRERVAKCYYGMDEETAARVSKSEEITDPRDKSRPS